MRTIVFSFQDMSGVDRLDVVSTTEAAFSVNCPRQYVSLTLDTCVAVKFRFSQSTTTAASDNLVKM